MNKVRIPLFMTGALDPAVTDKGYSNASGFTINGTSKDDVWYTLQAEAFKGPPDAVVDRAVYYALHYKLRIFSCEQIAAQRLYLPMLRDAFDKYGITNCAVVPYKYSTRLSKHARISNLQPRLKQGKWFFLSGKCDDLIRQLLRYPETGDEDDLIDSMAQHIDFARPYHMDEDTEEYDIDEDEDEEERDFRLNGAFVGRNTTRYKF